MSFLTAEWRKLAFANYAIDPAVLQPYVPYGTELDFWEDTCYVSFIGFLFDKVRIRGIKVPFHHSFEEVNLRFHVRHKYEGEWRRGVVFIKEIVPLPAVSLIANTLYGEQYETCKMRYDWSTRNDELRVSYELRKGGRWHKLALTSAASTRAMSVGSKEEFITEHFWGYTGSATRGKEYGVTHPRWQVYPVLSHEIDVDFRNFLQTPSFQLRRVLVSGDF